MVITESTSNSVTVLSLNGRLDGLTSGTLERRTSDLLAAGTRKLVFDCSQLIYVSSAGLRVFLSSAKKYQTAGGAVAFAALTPAVREAFDLSGFNDILVVQPTAAAAVAKLS